MNKWPLANTQAMNAYYGNPDPDMDGISNRAWEVNNLVRVIPPYPMALAWSASSPVKSFQFHRKAAPALMRSLTMIKKLYPTQGERDKYGLSLWGGAHVFRRIGGSSSLSTHSWGASIDLSTVLNPWGKKWNPKLNMMPVDVIAAFEAEGFVWGGRWKKPDAMHFQAAK